MKTKDLPATERPDEKLQNHGATSLSDAELLAIIIRTGSQTERSVEVATHLLDVHPIEKGLTGLNHLTLPELMNIRGIGKVKALQIQAVVELAKRLSKTQKDSSMYFQTPESIASYFMQDMRHLEREQVVLLFLNAKSKLLKEMVLSSGTVNSSVISPREIFVEALRYGAVCIIVAHNHPSGDPTPSKEDLLVTQRIKEAGQLIGIKLMDHVIIGDNRYISLKEKGFL